MNKTVKDVILEADTVEKAWALFESLLSDANGYSAETYLENAKQWATVAKRVL